MRTAGTFLLVSAALHVLGVVLAGFSTASLFLLVPAALYLVIYAGLVRGLMIAAWIGFIFMLGGIAGTIAELFGPGIAPDWVLWGILVADALAAVALFGAIWAGRHSPSST